MNDITLMATVLGILLSGACVALVLYSRKTGARKNAMDSRTAREERRALRKRTGK